MSVKKVACIGSGIIGSSWATLFALKGKEVSMYDVSVDSLNLAKSRIETNLAYLCKNGVMDKSEIDEIMSRISYTDDMGKALENVDFVQESVYESYELKQSIVASFEKYVSKDVIYASSTSGLLISEIAKFAKYPERFIGAHPYNPPHLIPLVELTRGDKTTDEVIAQARAFYISIDKEPVVLQKEALGFISNRLQHAVFREITELVCRGVCTLEDADKALTFGPALRWAIIGPSLVYQLGGGTGGINGAFAALQDSINLWLDDMADWKRYPEGYLDQCRAWVDETIANRPPEKGNTNESLAEYRDKMLINILKLHGKM